MDESKTQSKTLLRVREHIFETGRYVKGSCRSLYWLELSTASFYLVTINTMMVVQACRPSPLMTRLPMTRRSRRATHLRESFATYKHATMVLLYIDLILVADCEVSQNNLLHKTACKFEKMCNWGWSCRELLDIVLSRTVLHKTARICANWLGVAQNCTEQVNPAQNWMVNLQLRLYCTILRKVPQLSAQRNSIIIPIYTFFLFYQSYLFVYLSILPTHNTPYTPFLNLAFSRNSTAAQRS